VAFFDSGGAVREETVTDLGALLRRLEAKTGLDRHYLPCSPVTVQTDLEPPAAEFRIQLYSDIWFPRVIGMAGQGFSDRIESRELFDNRALAERHTPRFNRFLGDVSKEARARGATMEIDSDTDPIYELYREMCAEAGIRLE
jgi:hypothetical protein